MKSVETKIMDKKLKMAEMGFNTEDGYDYLQHIATKNEDEVTFYSCNENDDEIKEEDEKESVEIVYESYSDSDDCRDLSDMEYTRTDIDIENIISQITYDKSSDSRKRHKSSKKNEPTISDFYEYQNDGFDNLFASYDESSIDLSEFCTHQPSMFGSSQSYEPIDNSLKEEILQYANKYEETSETSEASLADDKFEKIRNDVQSLSIAERALRKYKNPEVITLSKHKNIKSNGRSNGKSQDQESEKIHNRSKSKKENIKNQTKEHKNSTNNHADETTSKNINGKLSKRRGTYSNSKFIKLS